MKKTLIISVFCGLLAMVAIPCFGQKQVIAELTIGDGKYNLLSDGVIKSFEPCCKASYESMNDGEYYKLTLDTRGEWCGQYFEGDTAYYILVGSAIYYVDGYGSDGEDCISSYYYDPHTKSVIVEEVGYMPVSEWDRNSLYLFKEYPTFPIIPISQLKKSGSATWLNK